MAQKTETKKPATKKPAEQKAPEKMYKISKEFLGVVRNVFGSKPFIQVAGVMPLLGKEEMTEGEVNTIINVLGNYPFDEVNQIFTMVQQHVKPIEAEEKTEAEKPAK
ncbi:MAG TPA: hypothetical protein P5509_02785 [Bacteroidales bacterium]|nr:hypothetical protein [Bacteroidales bacterium]